MKRVGIIAITILFLANINLTFAANTTCNHNWILNQGLSDEATCTKEGSLWYDCSICDDWKIVKTPATGIHDWTEWKADGYLCEDGKYTRYCKSCYTEEQKKREGDGSHIWSDWEIYSFDEPDCLNDGKKHRKCYQCYNYEYVSIPSNPKKHDWSNWYMTYDGKYSYRTCYTCKKEQKVTLSLYKKTLNKGKSFNIKIKSKWSGDKVKKYYSSNKKVATVSSKGKVTAKKKGKATITVKMKSGCKAVCKVTVR